MYGLPNFDIQVDDITKLSFDVVVNSLGVYTTKYGGICKSIISASKYPNELKDVFKRAYDVYDVGEFFFTDNYGIPNIGSICHLITPYKATDNSNLSILVYSIRNVLMSCKKLEKHRIGIPLIGAGENKYSEKEVFDVLKNLCKAFCAYFPDYYVTIVTLNSSLADGSICGTSRDYNSKESIKKVKKSTKQFTNYYSYNDKKIYFDEEFFLQEATSYYLSKKKDFEYVDKISIYISEYIEDKYGAGAEQKARKNVYAYLGYGKDKPIESGRNTFKNLGNTCDKATLFKLCFAVRMEIDEAQSFLNHFGYSFSHKNVNKYDDTIVELLEKHVYDIVEINKTLSHIEKTLFK